MNYFGDDIDIWLHKILIINSIKYDVYFIMFMPIDMSDINNPHTEDTIRAPS